MDINKFFESKFFRGFLLGLGVFIILLFTFKLGMVVGAKKADFSCRWSENYHQNFGGPKGGFLPGLGDRDFLEANGTFGQIIKIDGALLTIKAPNNVEKIIVTNEQTTIRSSRDTVKISDLQTDNYIVVIGEPNDAGQIEAKLIRVMPPLPPNQGQPGFAPQPIN